MKIIDRVFLKLNEQNLKAVDLANFLGVNKSVISNWKTRSTNPPSELLVPICEFLKVDLQYLLAGTQMETKKNDSNAALSEIENDIVGMFRQLDERDKEDVFDSIKLKYDKAVKKGRSTSLYSTYTEEKKNDTKSDTNGKDSGIA